MNKRISRSVYISAAVSAFFAWNMCVLVDAGPIERVFAKKDLPHGPAFGFYRTVWHEWPGMHENVYYEPELAEEVPYESVPEAGPELYPPDETPGPDSEYDDRSPAPPSQEPPPGLEAPMGPKDDAAPMPPAEAPMGPPESPGRPTEEGPAPPADKPVVPPGLEGTEDNPELELPMPRSQGASSSPASKHDLLPPIFDRATSTSSAAVNRQPSRHQNDTDIAPHFASQRSGRQANEHAIAVQKEEAMSVGVATDTNEKSADTVATPRLKSPNVEQGEYDEPVSESASSTTLNPLRANRLARPLARASSAPALRSLPISRQAQYTTNSRESDARQRPLTTDKANGRRPLFVNPLRARNNGASTNGHFQSNPLRATSGR